MAEEPERGKPTSRIILGIFSSPGVLELEDDCERKILFCGRVSTNRPTKVNKKHTMSWF